MMRFLGALARPMLAKLAPEDAHSATIRALKWAPNFAPPPANPRLRVQAMGLDFPNPLGLAAGFDKSAEVPGALLALGFGFVEVGTLTPRPQEGNPKPRLFRLAADAALINRFGFNNQGFDAALARLAHRPRGLIGVTFGANKDSADRVADYVLGAKSFAPFADYLTINVSSPNTAGLRDLQQRVALDDLVARVAQARDDAPTRRPLLIKIAPDLDLRELDDICSIAIARGVDGLIVSNTTIARPAGLHAPEAAETGGLSGRPLFAPSTRQLARAWLRCDGALTLIGVGGVEDAETARAKIEAGATLLQIYTGLVYRGPGVIAEALAGLEALVSASGSPSLAGLVGRRAREFAVET